MKRKTAALYNPYLDSLGGGEKHILSILKVLEEEGFQINIFWDQNLTTAIKNRLDLSFSSLKFLPNIFQGSSVEMLNKLSILKQFDVFFYVTDGSYFFSSAKKNYVFCMVPDRKLYPKNIFSRLKTINYDFITNSRFTGHWLKQWGIKNQVIYPRVDDVFLENSNIKKENIILSVGRFFPQLHSKKQDVLIDTFIKLINQNKNFSDWKLILTGGLKPEDNNYFDNLKKTTNKYSQISLRPNVSFQELVSSYRKAKIFWHFTGYDIDEKQHPEITEHLGIAPLEAMATGAITFCVNAGGPKEIIKDGISGFLFQNQTEIIEKTAKIINNKKQQEDIVKNAQQFVRDNFSKAVFKNNVIENIARHI